MAEKKDLNPHLPAPSAIDGKNAYWAYVRLVGIMGEAYSPEGFEWAPQGLNRALMHVFWIALGAEKAPSGDLTEEEMEIVRLLRAEGQQPPFPGTPTEDDPDGRD